MTGDGERNVVELSLVMDALNEAEEALPLPLAGEGNDGGSDGASPPPPPGAGSQELPPGCPVEPLGVKAGRCFSLDANRQVRSVKARDHSALEIAGLFGTHVKELHRAFPRHDKAGAITGFDAREAAEALIAACAAEGVAELQDRLRGPGAWRGDAGELVLHLGDRVWSGAADGRPVTYDQGAWSRPGRVGSYIYAAGAPQPRPSPEPASIEMDGAGAVAVAVAIPCHPLRRSRKRWTFLGLHFHAAARNRME